MWQTDQYEGIIKLDVTAYGWVQRRDIRKMTRFLPPRSRVLDVGCGFGIPTQQAARYFEMSACDVDSRGDPQFIEALMRRKGIAFKWSQPTHLPYPDATFDGLMLYAVFEHVGDVDAVADKIAFLRECHRVLKLGGKLFVFRAVNRHAFAEHVSRLLRLPTHDSFVVTRRLIQTTTRESGFDLLEWGYQGWFPENVPFLPAWLIVISNAIFCRLPLVKNFSHDFWFVAEKTR